MESKIATVFKYVLTTMLKLVPAILRQQDPVDFLFKSESDKVNAINALEKKIFVFGNRIESLCLPVKSEIFIEDWDALKNAQPDFVASLAYVGRKHTGSILPEVPVGVSDEVPDWSKCDFKMLKDAESLFNACRQDLKGLFCSTDNDPRILDRLEHRGEKFEATSACSDIRKIYWLLRVEIFLSIRFCQLDLAWDIHKHYHFGEDYRFWIELRSKDLPILSHLMDQSIDTYENDSEGFQEDVLNIAREHYERLPGSTSAENYGESDYPETMPRSQTGIKVTPHPVGQVGYPTEEKSQPEVLTQDTYQFFRVGEYWDLVWQGKRIRIKHMNGFSYIHQLLSNPRTAISVTILDSAGLSKQTNKTKNDALIKLPQMSIQPGSHPSDDIDIDFSIREQKELQNALKIALEQLEQLEQLPDTTANTKRRSDLKLTISAAKESLLNYTNPGNIAKLKEPMFEKARNNVRKGLKRAIKKIGRGKYLPEMAAHFKDTIQTGNDIQYRGEINWRLQ